MAEIILRSSDENLKSISLLLKVLHVLRLLVGVIARFFFRLYYGNTGKKLPPIIDDILKQPAVEVARKIRMNEITSVEVLETCIRRIKDINLALNCFIEDRFEIALKEAKEADEIIRSKSMSIDQIEKEKPFLGVPFTTKDSIAVKGLHQTAGVVLLKDEIAKDDAEVIKLLKDKGAVIIGLTSVPEACMWWETHNHIHGRTNNPYNTTRIVGGSSGGEGCLQAAAGSCFGIGSDIGGSIRMPAFFNGIFGHKPSRNIVSNEGQSFLPESEFINSFLVIGPMTRFAVDLKPLLQIISAENKDKLKLEMPVEIEKLKVFYQKGSNELFTDNIDPDLQKAMENVIEYLHMKHKIGPKEIAIEDFKNSTSLWFANMKSNEVFGSYIMKNFSFGSIILEIFKNIIGLSGNTFVSLIMALTDQTGVKYQSEEYKHYLKVREDLEQKLKDVLREDGVLLYPTHPTPAPYHNEPLFRPNNFSYTGIINCLGFPSTHIPLGLSREGLPIGIQVIANHNNDRLCLAVAEELDIVFGGWRKP